MNKSAPIGIFDSGVGGLTVMRKLIQGMPEENIIYFGDTARVPYGNKSKETIIHYTRQIVRFLESQNVKAIVIACNTASAYALDDIRKETEIPIIGVIEPGAYAAAAATRNGKIGIIGTYATIHSGAYESFLSQINPDFEIYKQACPLFVPFVEEGLFEDDLTDQIIARYLTDIKGENIDTLLLGCTHYPLIKTAIERFMGENVICVDPGLNTAEMLRQILKKNDLLNTSFSQEKANYLFYVSDPAARMTEFANQIMPFSIGKIQKINIEEY